MNITDHFRSIVEEYLAARADLSATALGVAALNDPRFVHDLLKGKRSPSAKTMDKVLAFIDANPVPAPGAATASTVDEAA